MVKLKIKNDGSKDNDVPELEFYLKVDDSGDLILYADETKDGTVTWEILCITPRGKYILSSNIPDNIGLQVTKDGCIKKE